ncbi:hypothetical protein H7Y21_02665 [Arenimonas sp.]|nr:hypothetical protein [Candidatus Parcubacteria bacterium]
MKNKQQGFSSVLIIIFIILLISGFVYLYPKVSDKKIEFIPKSIKAKSVMYLNNLPSISIENIGTTTEVEKCHSSIGLTKITDDEKTDFYQQISIKPSVFDYPYICTIRNQKIGFTSNPKNKPNEIYDMWLYGKGQPKLVGTLPSNNFEVVENGNNYFLLASDDIRRHVKGFNFPITGYKLFLMDIDNLELKQIKTLDQDINVCSQKLTKYDMGLCSRQQLINELLENELKLPSETEMTPSS